jgi:mono/diheme cytochrome c family protein
VAQSIVRRLPGLQAALIPLGAAFVALILISVLSADEAKTPVIHTVDGAEIFHQHCAPCHGVNGKGNGPAARALKHKVPDLTQISRRSRGTFPAEWVRNVIEGTEELPGHGSREMPVWGPIFHQIGVDQDLGNVRTDNVTKYIQSLQEKDK